MSFVAIKMGRRSGRDALLRGRACTFRVMWTGYHGRAGARPYHATQPPAHFHRNPAAKGMLFRGQDTSAERLGVSGRT
jgi:hypothetical protein